MAAMPPERSRSLHNFSLPPRLNWGSQRLLRCSKLHQSSSNDDVSFSDRKRRNSSSSASLPFRSPPPPHQDSQIDVIREKLMLEVDKFRANFLPISDFAPPHPPPWNLRTRRSPATADFAPPPPPIPPHSCGGGGGGGVGDGGERVKFSVPLSRNEIEDDFVEMIGRRPPRKPKKRPRYIQRQLDTLFPGLWLSEITADMYKVNENPELPK